MLPNNNFSPKKTGFKSIEKIGRIVLMIVLRFWKACTAGLLLLFLLYVLYGGIITLFLLTGAILGVFYHYQDSLLYFPDQPENSRIFVQSPRYLGVPYENLQITTRDDVLLNAVFLKQSGSRLGIAPTVVLYHGNAGNIGHRLNNASLLYSYTGSNILMLEYRGYGKSNGSPNEKGLELDAIASLEYLLNRSDIDHDKIVLYGRSLGGAVAVKVAAHEKYMDLLFAMILENTFTSIPETARHLFPWLKRLPTWCYKNIFPSVDVIRSVSVPTLFLSGLADQLVPPRHMMKLYNVSGACVKRIETFENGTHNDTWQRPGYTDVINKFLNEVYEARKIGLIPKQRFHHGLGEDNVQPKIVDL